MPDYPRPTRIPKSLWEKLKPLVREKRREPTIAENHLWQCLRNRQLNGLKFRRQVVIDRFIVDFYCPELQLVIEVDGSIHDYTQEEDAIRQQVIESYSTVFLRFTNDEVLNHTSSSLDEIKHIAASLQTASSPSLQSGEGAGG